MCGQMTSLQESFCGSEIVQSLLKVQRTDKSRVPDHSLPSSGCIASPAWGREGLATVALFPWHRGMHVAGECTQQLVVWSPDLQIVHCSYSRVMITTLGSLLKVYSNF